MKRFRREGSEESVLKRFKTEQMLKRFRKEGSPEIRFLIDSREGEKVLERNREESKRDS